MIHIATRDERNGEIAHQLIDHWQDTGRVFLALLDTPESLAYFGEGPHQIDRMELRMFLEEEQMRSMRQSVAIPRERRRIIAYEVVKFELRTDPQFDLLELADIEAIAKCVLVPFVELQEFIAGAGRDWHHRARVNA